MKTMIDKLVKHDQFIEKYVQKLINSKDIRAILNEIYEDGFEDGFNAAIDEYGVSPKNDLIKS